MMTAAPTEQQDGIVAAPMDDNDAALNNSTTMDGSQEIPMKTAEGGDENTAEEPESCAVEPQAGGDPADGGVPDILSVPEAAASVTPERKNELLLQARTDRLSWIQTVPLPYALPYEVSVSSSTDDNDPWSQDERLSLLKESNAVQSLPCIPQVLSSLYGMEQDTSIDVADRIQTMLEPLGLNQEECQLATMSFAKQSIAEELSGVSDKEQQTLLEAYHNFLTTLQTSECATLVQGMRRFIRNLPETQEEMASSLQSYLTATFDSLKSHAAWKNSTVDNGVKHALESFMYGQCRAKIQQSLTNQAKQDEEFLDRLQSLQFVSPTHLEVACLAELNADKLLKEAMDALLSVDSFHAPYEKVQRVLKVYHTVNSALSEALNKDGGSTFVASADDVLPTLILTILRSKPPHIVSNLRMIEVFCPSEYLRGEAGYAYTNLYGAFQFLRDMNLDNPESLSIEADDFRRCLKQSRVSAEAHLAKVADENGPEETKKEDSMVFPIEIPVSAVRAARLRGETVDLQWAKAWQEEHGARESDSPLETTTRPESADGLPDSLPPGFSRSYSYMVTRPEDIRVTDLPQLLSEYKMLVHATEQLLGERTARLAAERKQKFAATRSALLSRAAEVNLPTKAKKKKVLT